MRHGNNNVVENNVFFGNNAEHTGGIRVINAGQTIRNNYMEGLKGTRFGGALVVMNGVPNGPINRYDPVVDANIVNNTLIDSDNVQLGAGSDEERSGTPKDSVMANNLIVNSDGRDVFTVYDDMSGIDFQNNILGSMDPPSFTSGFEREDVSLTRADNGLLYPQAGINAGAARDLSVTTKDMVGPSWYPKAEPFVAFGAGNNIVVEPKEGAIFEAVSLAKPGDTIVLKAGDYTVTKFLKLDKPLTFKGEGDVNLTFERTALFQIDDGGSLQIIGLDISGEDSPDNAGISVIRTSPYSMLQNYRLEIIDSNFTDVDINHSFSILATSKGTFADNILIKDSSFKDVTGSILKLNKEDDDYGIYNSEYVTIENSTFENVGQELISYYRGGRDESTFGPHFEMHNSTVKSVGGDKRNKTKSSLYLHGVQVTNITGNTFSDSKPFVINHTVGEPKTRIADNDFKNVSAPQVVEMNSALDDTSIVENNTGLK